MDLEARMVKAETSIEALQHDRTDLRKTMDDGFRELRGAMERGFAAEREARERGIAELRREMLVNMRWMFGAIMTNTVFLIGIMVRLGGLF